MLSLAGMVSVSLKTYLLCSLVLSVNGNGEIDIIGRETNNGLGGYGTQMFNCAEETYDEENDIFNQTYEHCQYNRSAEYQCAGLHDDNTLPSLWISGCGTDPIPEITSCPESLSDYSTISNSSELLVMNESSCNTWLQTLPTDLLLPGRGGDTSNCEAVYVNWSAAICAKLPGRKERIAIRAISAEDPSQPGSERFAPYPGFFCGPYCAGMPDAQEYGNDNIAWQCANGDPLYTSFDRFQHALECAMGISTTNCCPTNSPTNSPTVQPSTAPTTIAEGPWPVPSCIAEDTCSENEYQRVFDAINVAYAVEEGSLDTAEDLTIHAYPDGDDSYDPDNECICEAEDDSRKRRDDNSVLRLGSRVVSFKPPTNVSRKRRNHFPTPRNKYPKNRPGAVRYIADGEYDQFDAGNFISTSLCGGSEAFNPSYGNRPDGPYLYYRLKDQCAVRTSCFGEGSSYRMRIDAVNGVQNIMHMRASVTTDDPEFFFIVSGNLGNDFHGNSENFTLSSADGRYVGFAWQTCNGPSSDYADASSGSGSGSGNPRMSIMSTPSVNHLVIVKKGDSTYQDVIQHSPSRQGLRGYYQAVKNITKGPLSYYLWYGAQDGFRNTCWDKSSFQTVFDAAITTTCSDFDCSNTQVCSSGCGETPAVDNCTMLGAPTPGPTGAPTTRFVQSDSSNSDDSKSLKIGLGIGFGVLGALLLGGAVAYKIKHSHDRPDFKPQEPNNGFDTFNAPDGI